MENKVIVRSNSELSAQLKSLRSSVQLDRSRDTSQQSLEDTPEQPPLSTATMIREKDRQIDTLRLELASMEVRLAEQTNAALTRSRQIEEALLQAKLDNIRLSENVESYQMLLQEKTLKGEYPTLGFESSHDLDEFESSRVNTPTSDRAESATSLATEIEQAENGPDSKVKGS
jgi:hypothetical protein